MPTYVTFQTNPTMADADPASMLALLTTADDEQSAVTKLAEMGTYVAGTVYVVDLAAVQAFEVTSNPDVTPTDPPDFGSG
jgi:hypothetical protein